MRQVFFNAAGCGVALPLENDNRLVTSGVINCVVLQVLSNDHIFAAHLTNGDTGDTSKLREFCTNIQSKFNLHSSNIKACTLWYRDNQKSEEHAGRIISTIQDVLGQTMLRDFKGGGIEFIVNEEYEVEFYSYAFNVKSILLVPDEVYDDRRRSDREDVVDQALQKKGCNNGFAVGIYEFIEEDEFEFKNENNSLIQSENEDNDEPRGFLRRLFNCCGCC